MLRDIEHSASALYDGGWRSKDREELRQEYHLTDEEAREIAAALEALEALDKTNWVNAITEAIEGKNPELYDVEIKDKAGGIHVIIPPGRRLFPDDDSRWEVTEAWTIGAEGSEYFNRYDTLEALVRAESEDWKEIIWPK